MIQRQEQATGADKNFTVFYGFPWWTPNNGVLPSEAQPLVKELIQDNFKKDRWYAAFRCLSPELASKEALLAIAEGRYAETIGEEFWSFSVHIHQKVADINALLLSKPQTCDS
jgi:hypothetical protein